MPYTSPETRRNLLASLSVTDLAYLAGFIDGEGSFTMEPRKHPKSGLRCRIPEICASSVDREVIDWLHVKCGGSVSSKRVKTDKHKALWCWTVRGSQAVAIADLLVPHLRIDRRRMRAEKLASFDGVAYSRTKQDEERGEAFAQELFAI
jgi:hypothetical protein